MITIEENKSYLIKPTLHNKLDLPTELVEIKIEKLSSTGKYAKVNILFTEQKPKTIWVLVNDIDHLVEDVIVYPY